MKHLLLSLLVLFLFSCGTIQKLENLESERDDLKKDLLNQKKNNQDLFFMNFSKI